MEPNNYLNYPSLNSSNFPFISQPQQTGAYIQENLGQQTLDYEINHDEELLQLIDSQAIAYLIERGILDPYTLNFTEACTFPPLLPFDSKHYEEAFKELNTILRNPFDFSFRLIDKSLKAKNLSLVSLLQTALAQYINTCGNANYSISLIGGTVRKLLLPWFHDNLKMFWQANELDPTYLPPAPIEQSVTDIDFRICLSQDTAVNSVRSIQRVIINEILNHAGLSLNQVNPDKIEGIKTFFRVITKPDSYQNQYTVTTVSFRDHLERDLDFSIVSDLENERLFELDRFKLLLNFSQTQIGYTFSGATINFNDEYQEYTFDHTRAWLSIFHNILKICKISHLEKANYAVWSRWLAKRVQGYYTAITHDNALVDLKLLDDSKAFKDNKPLIERLILTWQHHIPHHPYGKEALILQAYASLYRAKGLQEAKRFISTVAEAEKNAALAAQKETLYVQTFLKDGLDQAKAVEWAKNRVKVDLKDQFKLELTPSIFTDFIHLLEQDEIPLEIIHAYIELISLGHCQSALNSEIASSAIYTWKFALDGTCMQFPFAFSSHIEQFCKFYQVKDGLINPNHLNLLVNLHTHIFTCAFDFEDKLSSGLITVESVQLLVKTLDKLCRFAAQSSSDIHVLEKLKELKLYFLLVLQRLIPSSAQLIKIVSSLPAVLDKTLYQNTWKILIQAFILPAFSQAEKVKLLYLVETPETSFLEWAIFLQPISLKKACKLARAHIGPQDHLKGYIFLKQVMQKDFAEGLSLFFEWKKYFSKSEVEEILSDIDQELQINQRLSHSASKEQLLKELTVYLQELVQHQLANHLKTLSKKIAYILYHIYTFSPQSELVNLICEALKVTPFNAHERALVWQKLCESEIRCAINGHFQLVSLWFKGSHEKIWSKDSFKEGAGQAFLDKVLQALDHPQIHAITLKDFFKEIENYSISDQTKQKTQEILKEKFFNEEQSVESSFLAYQEELLKYVCEETRFRYNWKKTEDLFTTDLSQALMQLREQMDLALKYDRAAFIDRIVLLQQELAQADLAVFKSLIYSFSNFLLHNKVKKTFENTQVLWSDCFYILAKRLNTFDFQHLDQLKLVKDVTSNILRAARESSSLDEVKRQTLIELVQKLLQHLSLDPKQDKKLKEQIAAFTTWLFTSEHQVNIKILIGLIAELLRRCIPISFSTEELKGFTQRLREAVEDLSLRSHLDGILRDLKLHMQYPDNLAVKALYFAFIEKLVHQLNNVSETMFYYWVKCYYQMALTAKEEISLETLQKWASAADENSLDEKFWLQTAAQLVRVSQKHISQSLECYEATASLTINNLLEITQHQKSLELETYHLLLDLINKSNQPNAVVLIDILEQICKNEKFIDVVKTESFLKLFKGIFKSNLNQVFTKQDEAETVLECFSVLFEKAYKFTIGNLLSTQEVSTFIEKLKSFRVYQHLDVFSSLLANFSRFISLVFYHPDIEKSFKSLFEQEINLLRRNGQDLLSPYLPVELAIYLYELKNPKCSIEHTRSILNEFYSFIVRSIKLKEAHINESRNDQLNDTITNFYSALLLQIMFGSPLNYYLQFKEFWAILDIASEFLALDASKIIKHFVFENLELSQGNLLIATKFIDSYIESANFNDYEDQPEAYQPLRTFFERLMPKLQTQSLMSEMFKITACEQFKNYAKAYSLNILRICLTPLCKRFISPKTVISYALDHPYVDYYKLVNPQVKLGNKILKFYQFFLEDNPQDKELLSYLPNIIKISLLKALEEERDFKFFERYSALVCLLGLTQKNSNALFKVWQEDYRGYAKLVLHKTQQNKLSPDFYEKAIQKVQERSVNLDAFEPTEELYQFVIKNLIVLNESRLEAVYQKGRLCTYLARFFLDVLIEKFPKKLEENFSLIEQTLMLFEFDSAYLQVVNFEDFIKGFESKLPKERSVYIPTVMKWMRLNDKVKVELNEFVLHMKPLQELIDVYIKMKNPYMLQRAYILFCQMVQRLFGEGSDDQIKALEPEIKSTFAKMNLCLLSVAWQEMTVGANIRLVYQHLTAILDFIPMQCTFDMIQTNLNILVSIYNQTKNPSTNHPFKEIDPIVASTRRLEIFVHLMRRIGLYWAKGVFKDKDRYQWISNSLNKWIDTIFIKDMARKSNEVISTLILTKEAVKIAIEALVQNADTVDPKCLKNWSQNLTEWIYRILAGLCRVPDSQKELQDFATNLMIQKGIIQPIEIKGKNTSSKPRK